MENLRLVALLVVALTAAPASAGVVPCGGDCNEDGQVTVDEVIVGVNIALGVADPADCLLFDGDANGGVTVDELVAAITNALDGCSMTAPTPTEPGPTPTATPGETPVDDIPTSGALLLPWLQAGNYLDWPAESARHPGTGPHFGAVRTFVNPIVFDSLQQDRTSHPAGSALVKELYGSDEVVRGWAVMVKVDDDSAGGDNWYWYERFDTFTFADSFGESGCTSCHSLGQDFVRSPFPLQ